MAKHQTQFEADANLVLVSAQRTDAEPLMPVRIAERLLKRANREADVAPQLLWQWAQHPPEIRWENRTLHSAISFSMSPEKNFDDPAATDSLRLRACRLVNRSHSSGVTPYSRNRYVSSHGTTSTRFN